MRTLKILIAQTLLVLIGTSSVMAEDQSNKITIGSILILSGEGSTWGVASKNGLTMAVEEINSKGGVLGKQIEVIYQDDQGDPKKSLAAFNELTSVKGVRFIIGLTWSNLGLPLIDVANRNKVVMISPTLGMAKFNESSPYLFNTWPHDVILSGKLADYVFERGHRKVALIGAEHVWVKEQTEAFKHRFEELGGKIEYQSEPLPGTTDLRNEALKIKADRQIDALISTTDGVIVGSLVAKALRELQAQLPTYSITLDQAAVDAAAGGFEKMQFLTYLTPRESFETEYERRFKTGIDIGADSAYDALMMLVQAITKAGSTESEKVAAALSEIHEYNGMSGDLKSDGKRGFTKKFAVKQIRNGKISEPD